MQLGSTPSIARVANYEDSCVGFTSNLHEQLNRLSGLYQQLAELNQQLRAKNEQLLFPMPEKAPGAEGELRDEHALPLVQRVDEKILLLEKAVQQLFATVSHTLTI